MARETVAEKRKRREAIDLWLERVEAREQWSDTIRHTGSTVTGYVINSTPVIVLRFGDGNGWELFIPSSKSNKITESLDSAATFLGVDGCRDLTPDKGETRY